MATAFSVLHGLGSHIAYKLDGKADPEKKLSFPYSKEAKKKMEEAINFAMAERNAAESPKTKDGTKSKVFKCTVGTWTKLPKAERARIEKDYDEVVVTE